MNRLAFPILVATLVFLLGDSGALGFSFGRLFPASRSGIRGALIRNSMGQKTATNALKEAVKEASAAGGNKVTTQKTPTTRRPPPPMTIPDHPARTPAPQKLSHPVTNSPIYYIRLPPNPYVYMPGLGYVSPNSNSYNFIRPAVNFVNNGKPSNVYEFKPSTTTTTTTTTTPPPTTTIATTTAKPGRPTPTKKPSPITWLAGPWFFNGRPSNMFIFNSPHNPDHFDKLHQTYSKPGVYV